MIKNQVKYQPDLIVILVHLIISFSFLKMFANLFLLSRIFTKV